MEWEKVSKKVFLILSFVLVFIIAFFIGKSNRSYRVDSFAESLKRPVAKQISEALKLNARQLILMENPELVGRIMKGGAFGNKNFSVKAARNMFSKNQEAIEDVIEKTNVSEVAPGVWFIRLPIVNCTLIGTGDGLVLVDTGMKPAGPAVLRAIRSVSDKPIHTIIYTHGHVDHCYGTWALIEAGERPEIIAQENIKKRFKRYIRLRGSIARYMSQPPDQLPKDSSDIIWPTRYFKDTLSFDVGGVRFELKHYKGETDDQLFVWLPERKILLSADYYQGFLPNAGNGKRVQRHIGPWIDALREITALQPKLLLPSHGEALSDPQSIREDLSVTADALEFILDKTTEGLNAGLRKDRVFQSVRLPDHLRNNPVLKTQYVTAEDISKMVIRQYTGWWDDIPSHWSPAPLELQAAEIITLAGGIDKVVNYTRDLADKDLTLACHLADWAYYAAPDNPDVQQLVLDIYRRRIMSDESVTQEMLVYLDHMAEVRARMK